MPNIHLAGPLHPLHSGQVPVVQQEQEEHCIQSRLGCWDLRSKIQILKAWVLWQPGYSCSLSGKPLPESYSSYPFAEVTLSQLAEPRPGREKMLSIHVPLTGNPSPRTLALPGRQHTKDTLDGLPVGPPDVDGCPHGPSCFTLALVQHHTNERQHGQILALLC